MQRGVIVQSTYRVRNGRPVVQLYGRLSGGRPFLVEDDRFRPFIYIRSCDLDRLPRNPEILVESTSHANLSGEPVHRITLDLPASVPPLRDELLERGVPVYQADIRFPYLYLMHHGLRSDVEIDGRDRSPRADLAHFANPDLRSDDSSESPAELEWLSLDIETTPDANRVLSFALVSSKGREEVHLVSREPIAGAVTHTDERSLLLAFCERVRELDPDILIGWNVVDFDLRVLCGRFDALDLPMDDAQLGRSKGRVDFPSDRGFTRQSRAIIPGRMVLDGIPLVRDALRLPDYRLETVAQHVIGRGKQIDHQVGGDKAGADKQHDESGKHQGMETSCFLTSLSASNSALRENA
jgi:DNA polymerase-2